MRISVWRRCVCLYLACSLLVVAQSQCVKIMFHSQDLLKDFLDKQDNGELLIQKATGLLETILKEVGIIISTHCKLSLYIQVRLSGPSDGYLHIGDIVCLLHKPTSSLLSVNMPAARAYDARQLLSGCGMASSRNLLPCTRNVFVIGR